MWKDSIVGQEKLLESLLLTIREDHFSHAVIVDGSSGLGGLPLVLALSQELLCMAPGATGACGSCKSCGQVQKLVHPDLHIAFPVVKKEGLERKNTTAKDYMPEWRKMVLENPYITYNEWIRAIAKKTANGDINVKECSEIIQQLNMQSFSGDKKIQVIWIADQLGSNGNKLLKLIEEPPEGTFIFLISDNLENLLQTITSRCRIIKLPRIQEEAIAQALVRNLELAPDAAEQIAHICDGNFSIALDYAQLEQNNLMEICLQWIKICIDGDFHQMRQWAVTFNRYNLEEQKAILGYFLKTLQALLYGRILGEEHIRLSKGDKQQLLKARLLVGMDHQEIGEAMQLIARMITRLERYVNGRMVMFDACLHLSVLFRAIQRKKPAVST